MTKEEAIKIANEMYGWLKTDREKEALETLVPELLESEGEKVRKYIINFVELNKGVNLSPDDADRMLAWLEKQKEQKPAEQIEINKSLSEAVITELGKYNGENYWKSPWAMDSTGLQCPLYFANLGATWQKEQKPVEIEEIIRKAKSEGRQEVIDNPEYYQLQKPDWSEEDEKNSAFIVAALDAYARLRKEKNNTCGQEDFDKAVSWIHDRLGFIHPQPKPKWSENAWQRLKTIAAYLRYKGYEEDADFIESIPPQEGIKGIKGDPDPAGVWKPSDGQLKALKYFLAHHRLQMDASTTKWEEYDNLRSLYDILCKIAKS